MSNIKLSETFIRNTVKLALNEDLYPSGDITSKLIQNKKIIKAKLISNQDAIIGGLLIIISNKPQICSLDYYLESKKGS